MILAPKYLPRLAATVGLFTRYGLLDFARGQGLLSLEGIDAYPGEGAGTEAEKSTARAFRERLVELGPAYVKLGQVLSTRPDLLPAAYIHELENLQDSVEPMPFDEVELTIEQELGAGIGKLFGEFDREPLGSASLGQVHAAQLRDGRDVVVKIQRPGIREILAEDIEFFGELARFLTEHTSAGERVDMVGVVQQVERALSDELDYRIEARNAASFRRALARFPHILIPRVIDAYTTHRVLTSQRIRGKKVSEIPPIARIEHDFGVLAEEFARAYLEQITVTGHFHADPHPGNIFIVLPGRDNPRTPAESRAEDRRMEVRPSATPLSRLEALAQKEADAPANPEDARLALIDFGMTAHLTESMRNSVVRLLLAMAENQGDEAAEVLISIGEPLESFDRPAYVRGVSALVAQHSNQIVADTPAGLILYEMIGIGYREGLRLPAELTLLAKALFNLDAVTRALDPSFNPSETIRGYAGDIANERARRDLSPRRLFQIASATSDLMIGLPRRLDVITDRLAANDFTIKMDIPQGPMLLKGMEKIANRVLTGLVLAGLLVASGLLLPYFRVLGLAGFLVAGAIALYVVISILVSDRTSARKTRQ